MYAESKSLKNIFFCVLAVGIFLFAIVFSVPINGFTLGDQILNALHLPCWSNGNSGTHYTIFYSIGLVLLSCILIPRRRHEY